MTEISFDKVKNLILHTTMRGLNIKENKGFIAIVVAQDDLSPSQNNGFDIAQIIKQAILENGFNAKIFFAPTFPYITKENRSNIQLREFNAIFVEKLAECEIINGFVFVTSNIYSSTGMLKGAITTNLPCIFISNGSMSPIRIENKAYDLVALNEISALLRKGLVSPMIIDNLENCLEEQLGNNTFSYESNCGALMIQTLGLSLPNSVGAIANSIKQKNIAYNTGVQICKLTEERLTAKKIITLTALKTALALDLILGGSANVFINISWLADAIGEEINFKKLDKIANLISHLRFSYKEFDIRNFEKKGGVFSIIKNICNFQPLFNADYLCFQNKKMIDFCTNVTESINTSNELCKVEINTKQESPIQFLSGNIANSAISYNYNTSFSGTIKTYYSEDSFIDAIFNNEIKSGDCISLPYCGAKGGLFMPMKSIIILNALNLSQNIAIISDGIIPSFFNGTAISLINEEAYNDSPYAYIKDGDTIEINPLKGKINVDLSIKEIKARQKQIETKTILKTDKNYFYSKLVSEPENGCKINYSAR